MNLLRRFFQCWLAGQPGLYLGILRWTNRGSSEKKLFLRMVRRGDVVFDIGANLGYFTLLFSDLVGRTGEVHAFEPVARTFAALENMLTQQKKFDNIHLNHTACSDEEGKIEMHVPGSDFGQASMRVQQSNSWDKSDNISTETTRAIKLDGYNGSSNRIAFVKCDIEGAELLALKGMKVKLLQQQPLLFLEVCFDWTRNFGYSPQDLISFLGTLGYDRFYYVEETIHLMGNVEIELERLGNTSFNILVAVSGRHGQRLEALNRI